mmetsp:Transcript_21225/g.31526  ORF Transcript_21225/g.31526 Transcript_21225/m.31526 type:complete len:80 (-) Transcript_21225:333-572(-)
MAGLLNIIGIIQRERGNTEDATTRFAESEWIITHGGQAHNTAISLISLISSSAMNQNQTDVMGLFQSYGIEFYPGAPAA